MSSIMRRRRGPDLSHWKTSCLKGGAAKNPRSSQTGGNYCDRLLTAAPAASFNPQNRICKEIAFQRPKTGKLDYLGVPNHPAHSVAFEFFTDDYCLWLILKTLPEAPAFGGDMKAATASARVQRVRYSYSPSISLPV
jgi:hypothetical protein